MIKIFKNFACKCKAITRTMIFMVSLVSFLAFFVVSRFLIGGMVLASLLLNYIKFEKKFYIRLVS